MEKLFDRIRSALVGHLDYDSDGSDADAAARDVLQAISDATPEEIRTAIAENPEPARMSIEDFLELRVRAYASLAAQAKPHG